MRSAVALAVALLLVACNRGDDPTVGGDGTGTTAPTVAPTTAPTGVGTTASTRPLPAEGVVAEGPAGTVRAYLTDVRAAAQPGFDRVVFEFADAVPGYRLSFVRPPVTEDGSGREIPVTGPVLLEVRMDNAAGARLSGETVIRTYTGPKRLRPDTALVTEVVDAGDFEGAVTWVVGMRTRPSAVDVRTLRSPFRVVVDVRP